MDLWQCPAVVTGAASGLGAETARHLAEAGAQVTAIDIDAVRVGVVGKAIEGLAIPCDVSDAAAAEAAFQRAREVHGAARVLVNCVGLAHPQRILGDDGPMPLDDFRRLVEVNLISTFNMMRLAAADMARARADAQRRARRDHLDRVDLRLRRPERRGRLRRLEGRRGQHDPAGGARAGLVRHPRRRHRPRAVRHRHPVRDGAQPRLASTNPPRGEGQGGRSSYVSSRTPLGEMVEMIARHHSECSAQAQRMAAQWSSARSKFQAANAQAFRSVVTSTSASASATSSREGTKWQGAAITGFPLTSYMGNAVCCAWNACHDVQRRGPCGEASRKAGCRSSARPV